MAFHFKSSRKIIERFELKALTLGVIVGMISAVLILMLIDLKLYGDEKYFEVFSTILAPFIAAAVAILCVSIQVQSNFDMDKKDRLPKLDAARATLPIVLLNISRMCEDF